MRQSQRHLVVCGPEVTLLLGTVSGPRYALIKFLGGNDDAVVESRRLAPAGHSALQIGILIDRLVQRYIFGGIRPNAGYDPDTGFEAVVVDLNDILAAPTD